MPERQTDVTRRNEGALSRSEPTSSNPFQMIDRFADEMDRVFEDFGFGRGWLTPQFGGRLPRASRAEALTWAPDIEVFHRGNDFVVRADLPGLTKDDVHVDVTQETVTIQGERKRENEERRQGVYRSERSYGTFQRVIPLPDGATPDEAKAHFKDGVLEVTVPAPPESARHGRRLDIGEGPPIKR